MLEENSYYMNVATGSVAVGSEWLEGLEDKKDLEHLIEVIETDNHEYSGWKEA